MQKKILLVGCGSLGLHLARELMAAGHSVTATRRSVSELPTDLSAFAMDVTQPDSFAKFEEQSWDAIVVTLTARGEDAYWQVYVEGMRHLLTSLAAQKKQPMILFASSTSVYHQNDGSIVDEQSPTIPSGYSGKTMLATEASLQAAGLPFASVRFSGIYGVYSGSSDRPNAKVISRGGHLLQVLQSGRICPQMPERYSNRIHINDCVGVLGFLLQRYFSGRSLSSIYLASDGHPAPLRAVMERLAMLNQIPLENLCHDYLPNRGGNKRCVGKELAKQGYVMRVTDYQQGYQA